MTIDFSADALNMFSVNEHADLANVVRQNHADLVDVPAVLDRDVEVVSDDGASIQRRDILSFLDADMDGYTPGDLANMGSESFSLQELISDNGSVSQFYCRKVNSP